MERDAFIEGCHPNLSFEDGSPIQYPSQSFRSRRGPQDPADQRGSGPESLRIHRLKTFKARAFLAVRAGEEQCEAASGGPPEKGRPGPRAQLTAQVPAPKGVLGKDQREGRGRSQVGRTSRQERKVANTRPSESFHGGRKDRSLAGQGNGRAIPFFLSRLSDLRQEYLAGKPLLEGWGRHRVTRQYL